MKKFMLGFLLIFFFVSVVDCQRWNFHNGRKSSRTGTYYSEETKSAEAINSAPKSQNVKSPRGGGGIGAWGYVSIILFVILSGLGVYYTIIFYPIVCKKQRMYHVMGSTTV